MLSFLLHNITVWNDYFTGNPTLIQSNQYGTTQTLSGTSIHVLNCLFISISSSSKGGALYCTSVTCLLIESSSFFTCRTGSNQGGAIDFENTNNGQCVLHGVCGYDCYSTYTSSSYGQFSYIRVKNDALCKNYINFSSIIRCVNTNSNSDSRHTLACYNGNQCYPSVNTSNNKCNWRSGIYSDPISCLFSYSTFADNIATGSNCILLVSSSAKYEMKSCNIIRNTQGTLSSEGTFYINGNTKIEGSCILENRATHIFYITSSSYTVTLSNCTVDSTSNNGNLVMQNTVTKSFILALNHMSTRNCHSEYDSAGTLTPITPPLSCPKLQKLYCSCEKFFLQFRLSDVVSLISILIFNFIHQCSSSDL
jgi:hypothetical protein